MMCWLDGRLLPVAAARIAPDDRGFTLGDGVFETIAVRALRPSHLARHLRRLRAGAALLGIAVGHTDDEIDQAIRTLAASQPAPAVARLTLTRGPGSRGIAGAAAQAPTMLIAVSPMPPPAPPAHAIICRTTCRNQHSPLSRIKSLNYLDSILAQREALSVGADDAILLNTEGKVAEASSANLLAHLDGRWVTPPVDDGALPGIARALLMERCGVTERSLLAADLRGAAGLLLCNSLGVRAVAKLDGKGIAGAKWPGFAEALEG